MDKPVVAIDDGLEHLRPILTAEGFQVQSLQDGAQGVAAVVVSGGEDNVTGVQRRVTPAVVIDATGLAAQEVVRRLRERLGAGGRPR